jgi:hypothetical protein
MKPPAGINDGYLSQPFWIWKPSIYGLPDTKTSTISEDLPVLPKPRRFGGISL